MEKMPPTGVRSSRKGRHLDEPKAVQGHTSGPLRGPEKEMEKRMME